MDDTTPNTKGDIPDGERLDIAEETTLDVPELPPGWRWTTANHYIWNHKTNVFFGGGEDTPGGYLGEIDNFPKGDDEGWALHIRPIVDDGTDTGLPRPEPETTEQYDTLAAAIEAVPGHLETHYGQE